jgi:hypothetical protein
VPTIKLAYGDSFDVCDNDQRIGGITLMSDGWAAYRASPHGVLAERRMGTYPDAESAIKAIEADRRTA